MQFLERHSGNALSLLRIMSSLLFIEHGTMKLLHFPAAMPGLEGNLPPLMLVAALLELVGGTLLAIGLMTRPVAFVLSGQMAVAYFMAHASQSFFPAINMGDAAVLFCFIFLYIACAGAGPISIDAMRQRSAD